MCTQKEVKMENVGVRQFRDNLSQILNRVEQGEIIKIVRHGKDIAELRPIEQKIEQQVLNRLQISDKIGGGKGEIGTVKTVKNLKPDRPVSDIVSEDRR